MLLMIDNYDSFTYNLVHYCAELGEDVRVFRNDRIDVETIDQMQPRHIIISPGPCTPDQAGVSVEAVSRFAGSIPLLGVCLGHQCIGQAYGGNIVHASRVMHGKTSAIHHCGEDLYSGLKNPFTATRYHSLVIDRASLPDCLTETAWTAGPDGERDEIMGIRHVEKPVFGVQFHPESILTEYGHQLLQNFLDQSSEFWQRSAA